MPKSHVCINGTPVTDQVVLYQKTHTSIDYVPVYQYYNEYKDTWFGEVEGQIDRVSFDADFDWKLFRAISTFNYKRAKLLAKKNNWKMEGAFNRWFWRILCNWISNVKSANYRIKKRPSVVCPVCGRRVVKIDEEHLKHYMTKSDLPVCFVWKKRIYQTCVVPADQVVCWGKFSQKKYNDIMNGEEKKWSDYKYKCKWLWYDKNGNKSVFCPLSRKLVPEITNEYIRSLPRKCNNRYAESMTWFDFIEKYSYNTLIESEVYSLDHVISDSGGGRREIYVDAQDTCEIEISSSSRYENVEHIIDTSVEDLVDREILKLIAYGCSDTEVCEKLNIRKTDLKNRKRTIQSLVNLESNLCNSIVSR